jgi:hypothetical protein
MSRPLVEQRRLQYRGREFHFVSYDGQPANPKRGQPATEPSWWLMVAGKRWEVMPFDPSRDPEDLDRAFAAWLDEYVFPAPDGRGD